MREVAHHLQTHAHNNDGEHRDAFARSSYNRYYYACFLYARSAFAEMNPNWAELNHKDYPEILRGQIQKHFKEERKKAHKNGDDVLVRIVDTAIRATEELSKIMGEANAVRIVADYKPSIKVEFIKSERFSLNSVNVTKAHEWCERVILLADNILAAWRQTNA